MSITDAMAMPIEESAISKPSGRDWIRQGAILALAWATYSAVRSFTDDRTSVAMGNAHRVLDLEAVVGIDIEQGIQSATADLSGLVGVANWYYLVHFPVTIGVGLLLFLRSRHDAYANFRNALIVVSAVALVIHLLYPLAPPRLVDGFVDTGALFGPDPYSLPGSGAANQLAAMPSMHVAWSIIVAVAAWNVWTHRPVRLLAAFHPLATLAAILVTANHFVIDAVVAVLLVAIAWALARPPRWRSADFDLVDSDGALPRSLQRCRNNHGSDVDAVPKASEADSRCREQASTHPIGNPSGMTFSIDTFKATSTPVDVTDVDVSEFKRLPVSNDGLRCLRYMHNTVGPPQDVRPFRPGDRDVSHPLKRRGILARRGYCSCSPCPRRTRRTCDGDSPSPRQLDLQDDRRLASTCDECCLAELRCDLPDMGRHQRMDVYAIPVTYGLRMAQVIFFIVLATWILAITALVRFYRRRPRRGVAISTREL